MSTMTSFNDVSTALRSTDAVEVMGACWEAFSLGERTADAASFREGFDELQAVVAAQVCMQGQLALPLPGEGAPVPLPGPPEVCADACAVLLQEVQSALSSLAESPSIADAARDSLREAASLAGDGAACLGALRST